MSECSLNCSNRTSPCFVHWICVYLSTISSAQSCMLCWEKEVPDVYMRLPLFLLIKISEGMEEVEIGTVCLKQEKKIETLNLG